MSKDRATNALYAARRLASQGKYAASLKKHVWFHNHALKYRKSFYGVRLSFALSDWVELGENFPPALSALRRIRDKKTERLLRGEEDRALFHDVDSINDHLEESLATVELFKKIERKNARFALIIYDIADEAIIAAGEYDIAIKCLGDPVTRFDIMRRHFREGMQHAETSRCKEASKRAHRAIFVGDVVRLITVLEKARQYRMARALQSKALAIVNRVAIRDAIKKKNRGPAKMKSVRQMPQLLALRSRNGS